MLIVDALIVILAILIGVRIGGVAVAFTGAAGLAILTFVFGIQPTAPPITVMLIILAVTSLAGVLQCSGGLDYLVSIAEKILRNNPNKVTVIAPIVVFAFVVFTGTSFIAMALIPVISEVARGAGVRPERPLSASCAAASYGIAASPLSAATAAMIGILGTHGIDFGPMMMVLIPSIFIAIICGSISVYKRGKELSEDEEFQRRLASGEISYNSSGKSYTPTKEARIAVILFALAVLLILILGTFKELLPSWTQNGKVVTLSIANVIEIVAMTAGAIIMVVAKVKPAPVMKSSVFNGGVVAVMVCFGVCFMTDTFFAFHKNELIGIFGEVLQNYPWLFAIVLVAMSAILMSQGATAAALMPLGVSLGIEPTYLVAMTPAICCTWFFPVHANILASVAMDPTGTMNLGTWILNHSTMRPGLVTTVCSVVLGFIFASVVF